MLCYGTTVAFSFHRTRVPSCRKIRRKWKRKRKGLEWNFSNWVYKICQVKVSVCCVSVVCLQKTWAAIFWKFILNTRYNFKVAESMSHKSHGDGGWTQRSSGMKKITCSMNLGYSGLRLQILGLVCDWHRQLAIVTRGQCNSQLPGYLEAFHNSRTGSKT